MTTKMTPFEENYGYLDLTIRYFLQYNSKVHKVESHMASTKETSEIPKENLQMEQNMVKKQVNQN